MSYYHDEKLDEVARLMRRIEKICEHYSRKDELVPALEQLKEAMKEWLEEQSAQTTL